MKQMSEAIPTDGFENVSEIAQTTQDIIAAAEPSLSSLGLCAYTPVGLVQSVLEFLHVNVGLPWWGSIALCTVAFRTLMLPIILKGQINAARLNKIKPELESVQAEMRELSNSQDTMKKSLAAMKLQRLFKDNQCHPLKVCAKGSLVFWFSSVILSIFCKISLLFPPLLSSTSLSLLN